MAQIGETRRATGPQGPFSMDFQSVGRLKEGGRRKRRPVLRVCIFTTIPKGLYSGGRYLSLILAYALRRAGAEVTYVTNNLPLFDADFAAYEDGFPLRKVVSPTFEVPEDVAADWVVVIPTGSFDDTFYDAALGKAEAWGARVALLSFETPNWFNRVSPYARSAMPTESWRKVVARGGAVITIAREGIEPARRFFGEDRKDLVFDYWHPAINDLAAAQARANPDGCRRITAFVRTEDRHKGAHDLLNLDPTLMAGQTLSLVFGRGVNRPYVDALARHFGGTGSTRIELYDRISDLEKFDLLASSKMLLFPSYFEGYGYPPVEAGWMDVPSVAYDLPLLHETVADTACYAPPGDVAAFGRGIAHLLASPRAPGAVRGGLVIAPDTLNAGRAFLASLERAADRVTPMLAVARPAAAVPQESPVATVRSRALSAALSGDLQIENLQASVKGRTVTLQGIVRGQWPARHLRFDLPDCQIPDVALTSEAEAGQAFRVQGYLSCWNTDKAEQTCEVLVVEPGGECALKTTLPVGASVQLLFERDARFPFPAASQAKTAPGVLLRCAAADLFRDPVLALSVAAMTQTLHELSVESTLLLTGTACVPTASDTDFLPLVDQVLWVEGDGEAEVDAALMAGGLVVQRSGAAAPMASELVQGWGLPGRQDGLEIYRSTESEDPAVPMDEVLEVAACTAARRSRIERQSANLLILSGAPSSVTDPMALCRLVDDLANRLPGLKVVMPERMIGDVASAPAALMSRIQPLSERMFAAEMASAACVARLALGPVGAEDPLLEALLSPSETLRCNLGDALADPVAVQAMADDLARQMTAMLRNPLTERLAWLRRDATAFAARRFLGSATSASAVAPLAFGVAPLLSREDSLCFTAPRYDAVAALVEGWDRIDEHGSLLDRPIGIVGFRIEPEIAETEIRLEILLRCKLAGTRYRLGLNGRTIATLSAGRMGVQSHAVTVKPSDWGAPETVQYLSLQVVPKDPEVGVETALLAIGVSSAQPEPLTWEAIAPTATQRAKTLRILPPEFVFRTDAMMGGCRLEAGFAGPEPMGTWTSSPAAVISFEDRLQSDALVVVEIEGDPFLSDLKPVQHVSLSAGETPLGHMILPSGTHQVGFALPAAQLRHGVDNLFLDCPDAHSPKDAGLSGDIRPLALLLRRLRVIQRFGVAEPLRVRQWMDASGAEPVTFSAAPGVLRLAGRGQAAGHFLQIGSCPALVPLQALPGDRWEAQLWLSAGQLREATNSIALALFRTPEHAGDALPLIEALEFRPAQEREAPAPRPVTLQFALGSLLEDPPRAGAGKMPSALLCDGADLTQDPTSGRWLGAGWGGVENGFAWNSADVASVNLCVGAAQEVTLAVLRSGAFVAGACKRQRQRVRLGTGPVIATLLRQSYDPMTHVIPIAARGLAPAPVVFEFEDSCSPRALGLSTDDRRLSMAFVGLKTEPLAPVKTNPKLGWSAMARSANMQLEVIGGHEAYGSVFALRGVGAAPAAVRLDTAPGIVFHPVALPDGGWRALVFGPKGVAAQRHALVACRPDPASPDGFAVAEQICSFEWPLR